MASKNWYKNLTADLSKIKLMIVEHKKIAIGLTILIVILILLAFAVACFCHKKGITPNVHLYEGVMGIVLTVLLGAIGILVSIIIFRISDKSSKKIEESNVKIEESNDKIKEGNNDIKELLKMRHEEIINIYGFSPLNNPFKNRNTEKNGFELFDDSICDLVERAEHSVKLCLVTPLLHSLRMEWKDGYLGGLHHKDHWAKKFCMKFIQKIPDRKDSKDDGLRIEILYLENRSLRELVLDCGIPWDGDNGYERSISYFFDGFTNHLCRLKKYTISKIPMYFALIDSEYKGKARGVMAFFDYMDLKKKDKDKTNDKIAEEFQGFEFSDFQIIQYFDRFFENLKSS